MARAAAGDQRAGPGTQSFAVDRRACGGCQPRIGRQGQVIVRAEIDELLAVQHNRGRLRSLTDRQPPAKMLLVQCRQLRRDPGEPRIVCVGHGVPSLRLG